MTQDVRMTSSVPPSDTPEAPESSKTFAPQLRGLPGFRRMKRSHLRPRLPCQRSARERSPLRASGQARMKSKLEERLIGRDIVNSLDALPKFFERKNPDRQGGRGIRNQHEEQDQPWAAGMLLAGIWGAVIGADLAGAIGVGITFEGLWGAADITGAGVDFVGAIGVGITFEGA